MKLKVSDKTSNYGRKPHIKKGYYAGKFLAVEERKNPDGTPYEGKYGKLLVMEFEIYKSDENDKVTEVLNYIDSETNIEQPVRIANMVYHTYKDKNTGEHQTAITANSAITKLLIALGWKFDATGDVDVDKFIGNFVELNIDDFEQKVSKDSAETYTASTIKGVNVYKGSQVTSSNVTEKKSEEIDPNTEVEVIDVSADDTTFTPEIQAKMDELKKQLDKGSISKPGYDKAIESLSS